MEIHEKVKEMVADLVGQEPADIDDLANLTEDLNMDSLDKVELALQLEEEFSLPEITDEKMEKLVTVQDIITTVVNYADKTSEA